MRPVFAVTWPGRMSGETIAWCPGRTGGWGEASGLSSPFVCPRLPCVDHSLPLGLGFLVSKLIEYFRLWGSWSCAVGRRLFDTLSLGLVVPGVEVMGLMRTPWVPHGAARMGVMTRVVKKRCLVKLTMFNCV